LSRNNSDSVRNQIRRQSAIQSNPGLSISRQAVKRFHILYGFGRARWAAKSYFGTALGGIRNAAQSRVGREALVIANGHSTSNLDPHKMSKAIKGGLDVFALNSFLLSDLARQITPSHYILSDGAHHPDVESDLSSAVWNVLDAHPEIQLITPHGWYPTLRARRPSTIYFNDCGLEGWTKNISPLRPRGYISLTAYKALALAIHLGYERIHIIGFDNSNYLNYQVDESGRIFYGGDTHFYSADSPVTDASDMYPQGMADCLFDFSLCLLDLERCFGHAPIYNLDLGSNTRAFTKIADSRFLLD